MCLLVNILPEVCSPSKGLMSKDGGGAAAGSLTTGTGTEKHAGVGVGFRGLLFILVNIDVLLKRK